MSIEEFQNHPGIKKQTEKIKLEIALAVNQKLWNENKITYQQHQYAEEYLLKKINNDDISNKDWK